MPEEDSRTKDEQTANLREPWRTVREAAAQLGVSVRAVQMRVQRGTLASRRDGKTLYVRLDPNEPIREQFAKNGESPSRPAPDLVEQLRSEIAFLRERVQQHETAEGELRRLMLTDRQELLDLRQRLAITAAPQDAQEGAGEAETGAEGKRTAAERSRAEKRPWWRWWSR